MNRKFLASIIVAVVCQASSAPASQAAFRRPLSPPAKAPAPAANPRNIFQSLYNTTDAAGSRKDLDGYMANCMQDFTLTELSHKNSDLEDIRYRLGNMFDNAQSVRSWTTVTSASIKGQNANVMVKSSLAMRLINPRNNAKFVIIDKIVSKDTWIKNGDTWMLQKSQIISEQNTANGRLIADKNDPFAPPKPKNVDDDETNDGGN